MRRLILMLCLVLSFPIAHFAGFRVVLVDTLLGTQLRNLVYDGGSVERLWTDFSGTVVGHAGSILGFAVLAAFGVVCMYLVGLLAISLFSRVVKDARDRLMNPILDALSASRSAAVAATGKIQETIAVGQGFARIAAERAGDGAAVAVDTIKSASGIVKGSAAVAFDKMTNLMGRGTVPPTSAEVPLQIPAQKS